MVALFIGSVDGLANDLVLLGLGDFEVAIVFEVGDVKDRSLCLRHEYKCKQPQPIIINELQLDEIITPGDCD